MRSSQWLAAIHWALQGIGGLSGQSLPRIPVQHVSNWDQAARSIQAAPASVLLHELSVPLSPAEERDVPDFAARFPDACLVVLGPRSRRGEMWQFRQMGAAHSVDCVRNLTPTLELALRKINHNSN